LDISQERFISRSVLAIWGVSPKLHQMHVVGFP